MARYFGTNIISGDLPVFTQAQIDAINSGINSTAVSIYDNHVSNNIIHVTASDKTNWNAKQDTITGAATTITSNNLTASKAVISNSSGKVDVSDTTSTELSYVHGVTSAIQTQLNTKAIDSDVVHKNGTETITGEKTIQNNTLYFKDSTNTIGTFSSDTWFNGQIRFLDSAGARVARLQPKFISGTNIVQMGMYAGNNTENGITINGTGETSAPTPATSDNSTKIATTAFVRNRESDIVHISGTETITGAKTFRGGADTAGIGTSTITIDNISSETGVDHFKDITFSTSDNNRIAVIRAEKGTDEKRHLKLGIVSTANTWPANIDLYCDADGSNPKLQLPAEVYGTNFHGTADYAKWADLAECYKPDQKYSVGTLIKFGGEKDITIANNKCNGVISDKPGFVLDAELEDSQPIALVGKTPIRIIGKVNKFDNITLSEISGVGRVAKEGEKIIAKALESSNDENEKLILCVTKFNLD